MKKNILLLLFLLLFSTLHANDRFFSFEKNSSAITNNPENTLALSFNSQAFYNFINSAEDIFILDLPCLDESFINVSITSFNVLSKDHNLIIETEYDQIKKDFQSSLLSFKINHKGENIGVLIFLDNKIIISYKNDNQQLEINLVDSQYFLFDVNDCINEESFSCAVEEEIENITIQENSSSSNLMTPVCLELAIEIDQFTRNTFSSDINTANWAHAIIAGISQVFYSELNINVSVSNTIVWNSADPYSLIVNDAGAMLDSLRTYWIANNSSISRDLVHLLTKRGNTGTGGIAYVDVLCSNSWGYAFSSALNNNTNFSFPNPSYTWNLFVCAHEIGHNVGSNHTHWCGWGSAPWLNFSGGPIDNCVDVEGSCSNNPADEVGTIMSYCHTTSSGALIDFHQVVVSLALLPGINGASCLTICAFYGCTDTNATNFDPNATVDDSSCVYPNLSLTQSITSPSCNGDNNGIIDLTVIGGLAPFSFLWSNGEITEDIYSLVDGVYTVTVNDALGNVISNSFSVNHPDSLLSFSTINNTSDSTTSDGSIFVNASGGTYPYIYYWNNGSSYLNDTTPYLLNLSFGTYNLFIVDINNCFEISSYNVGVDSSWISGCTDPNASNYNPNATTDDGSCTYFNCASPVPSGLSVNWTTDTKASVSWDNMNDNSCMVFKYFVRYRVDNLDGTYGAWVTKSAGVGNGLCNFGLNTTEKRLQFLSSGTTYQFKMKAFYCGGTESGYSTPTSFTTGGDCPALTNLAVQTFNGNQAKATFTWDSTGVYVFARVALRVDTSGASWGTAGGFGIYYPTLTVNKFGLTPGQSYRAQARAFCDSNITSYRSTWTSPSLWTQPGTLIKNSGGSIINNLDVYPNPSSNIFNITFISAKVKGVKIRVLNTLGGLVFTEDLGEIIGEYTKQINLSNSSKGIYLLQIISEDSLINKKLIFQ